MRTLPTIKTTPKRILKTLLGTIEFNVVIALFLTAIKIGGGFTENLIFSQCIGLSICSLVLTAFYLLVPEALFVQLFIAVVAIIAGSVGGSLLGSVITGTDIALFHATPVSLVQTVLFGILFGAIISFYFISRDKMTASQALIQEERIKRLYAEKKIVESDLKRLQAQIEPQFLFNTLASILSLLESEPIKGRTMLKDLTLYLRATLSKTRSNHVTMEQEIKMITAYINIFKGRMGARLRYACHIPDTVRSHLLPPMLLQPLVENAIKHGIEPEIDGGQITITASVTNNRLRIEIADTGLGFDSRYDGLGLTNVKERLQALYGEQACLILEENYPSGVKAIIEAPYDTP
jgi:sensor histidine kinase YesM